jgi:RNA polymerase sigma-70 factor (ECF subfamily)
LHDWAAGDNRAGQALFSNIFPLLVRFFRNKVSGLECEDLVQKTMMALVEKHERFRGESSFRTFVLGMARIELLRFLRARHRKETRETDFEQVSVADLDPSPSEVTAQHQRERLLLEAFRAIPVELQLVLELHYWEDMTAAEIAQVIDKPVGTAKSRLRRAKERLEATLGAVRPAA